MASDRRSVRRDTRARGSGRSTAADLLSPRRRALDESIEQAPGEPGEPAGFGTEASTASTSDVDLDSYTVPDGRTARLHEASLSIAANGEASVHVNGVTYGPFTGAIDVALPFGGAYLGPGYTVKVTHESTDGASATNRATVTVKEV